MSEMKAFKPPDWLRLELQGGPDDGMTLDIDRRCLRPDSIIRVCVEGRVYEGNGPYQGLETHETLTRKGRWKDDDEGEEVDLTGPEDPR